MDHKSLIKNLRMLQPVTRRFSDGAFLFRAGEPPSHITIIRDGQLTHDLQLKEGMEHAVRAIKTRRVWGLKETILGETYGWNAWAVGQVEVELVSISSFREHLDTQPLLRFQLLTLFANELTSLAPSQD